MTVESLRSDAYPADDPAEPAGAAPPEASLSPARREQVLDRIAGGFYDRDEVRDEVGRRAAKDLPAE
jgi:hypothetical protein